MKNEIVQIDKIENLIYIVEGVEVMLDSDLAELYHVETKRINEAVKNNSEKFPERYAFRIEENKYNSLKSKISTSKGGSRKGHTVFTEQGVYMLATILKSNVATRVTLDIMDAFVKMRKYISTGLLEQNYINDIVLEDHDKIKMLEISFQKLEEKRKVNEIYFNGQIYDAYSKIQEIFNSAKKRLIIIDSYADNTILDIVKRLKTDVIIITKGNNLLTAQDIEKYNKRDHNLKVIYDNTYHDRYFIIDNNEVYHCGASINRIGYKTFSITLMSDDLVAKTLIDRINNLIRRV